MDTEHGTFGVSTGYVSFSIVVERTSEIYSVFFSRCCVFFSFISIALKHVDIVILVSTADCLFCKLVCRQHLGQSDPRISASLVAHMSQVCSRGCLEGREIK